MEATTTIQQDIAGLSRAELAQALEGLGLPSFRIKQIWKWVYNKGVRDFESMSDLGKDLRARLAEGYSIKRLDISRLHKSNDGTVKFLLKLPDGNEVETVYIPEDGRGTICVSSQVGCTLNCTFCHTGTQKLVRNLTPAEIVGQVMVVCDFFNEWALHDTGESKVTHIVMMGMGEPFYNYENVATAIKIMMDQEGLAFSRRKITVSTSGVVPRILECGQELGVNLALSLHAPTNETRTKLVPLNKKYPVEELIKVCREYQQVSNSKRITFEYTMIKGMNDSIDDARKLAKLISGIPSVVNIIPFNKWPGTDYECSDMDQVMLFADTLKKAGVYAPIRTPRGRDIYAACGQLKSDSVKILKRAC